MIPICSLTAFGAGLRISNQNLSLIPATSPNMKFSSISFITAALAAIACGAVAVPRPLYARGHEIDGEPIDNLITRQNPDTDTHFRVHKYLGDAITANTAAATDARRAYKHTGNDHWKDEESKHMIAVDQLLPKLTEHSWAISAAERVMTNDEITHDETLAHTSAGAAFATSQNAQRAVNDAIYGINRQHHPSLGPYLGQ